ncbi:hypothetical protein [Streptoalloteichus hindustanus]|uniref:Uncharacterized protein n=1 Tax=Streptoalloteichus hindustanus TaxID=2017 RepID=A0A1M5MA68_STRHI|nr:hypothetical protein [Streptoalloteichus hindustanus]SHG74168.1 hypothetical protein SAMN05444320_11348 [Streptoalloteichus hindustanus]
MTRHYLTPTTPQIADYVVVGYDRPLNTFFAQVMKESTDDEPQCLLWKGCDDNDILNPREVIDLVRDYAHIPDALVDALTLDMLRAQYGSTEENNAVTHWSRTGRINPSPPGNA